MMMAMKRAVVTATPVTSPSKKTPTTLRAVLRLVTGKQLEVVVPSVSVMGELGSAVVVVSA